MQPWLWLPSKIAHDLSPYALACYAAFWGEEKTPVWNPFQFQNIIFNAAAVSVVIVLHKLFILSRGLQVVQQPFWQRPVYMLRLLFFHMISKMRYASM